MFAADQYELCEFGNGWKVERFAGVQVKRETPAAEFRTIASSRLAVPSGTLTFSRDGERWSGTIPDADWRLKFSDNVSLALRPSPFGHLGVFPEQSGNWQWLAELGKRLTESGRSERIRAINLFGYTGGSTLAIAGAGIGITHVDAAKNICSRARANAKLSGIGDRPVRWIAEDVMTFVRREIKRGNYYDIVIADPPSFGRGPKKQQWKLERDFQPLLDLTVELTRGKPEAILLSCHTEGFNEAVMQTMIARSFGVERKTVEALPMFLESRGGERLPSGHCARWSRQDISCN